MLKSPVMMPHNGVDAFQTDTTKIRHRFDEGVETNGYPIDHTIGDNGMDDTFFYGFRDVEVVKNGKLVSGQVPLSQDDVLHPQEGDYVSQSDYHIRLCVELYQILQVYLTPFPWMYVLYDVLVNWRKPRVGKHAPDLAVIDGVTNRNVEGEFDFAVHGGSPVFAMEMTSNSTRNTDINKNPFRDNKYLQYQYIGIPYYLIIDQAKRRQGNPLPIFGHELIRGRYRAMHPNRLGQFWIPPLGLALGPYQDRVAWFDANGTRLENLQESQYRAQQEAFARHVAEFRAQQEAARAQQEAQARQTAEEELRQLKAKLGILD